MQQNHGFGQGRQAPTFGPTIPNYSDTMPTPAPTPTLEPEQTADLSSHTMTVAGFASLLHGYGLDRDERTIQRWCKAGKFTAALDPETSVWKIEPVSAEQWLRQYVAAHEDEIKHRSQVSTSSPTGRDSHADAAATTGDSDTTRRDDNAKKYEFKGDIDTDTPPTGRDNDATESVDVAALRKKVAALETQVVTLEADKKVREQMNDYMRDQFESMNA